MSEPFFTPEELKILRRHYFDTVPPAQRLTEEELEVGIQVATTRQLKPPPLSNQIYFQKRAQREKGADGKWGNGKSVMSIQTGIDALRLIAERSGKYCGSGLAVFEEDTRGNVTRATIEIKKLTPNGTIGVWYGDAWYDEYVQYSGFGDNKKPNKMWEEKPRLMLSKCAEALGLRKAFPEMSGLYTTDEMGEEDVPATPVADPTQRPIEGRGESAPSSSSTHRQDSTPSSSPRDSRAGQDSQQGAVSARPAAETTGTGSRAGTTTTESQSRATGATSEDRKAFNDQLADDLSLAAPEKKKKLAAALALACTKTKTPRADMVALVKGWSDSEPEEGQQPVIDNNGTLATDLTEDEYQSIVKGFRSWEIDYKAKKAMALKKADQELEARERAPLPITEDDIPF